MKAEVSVGSAKSNETQHKFGFNVQAVQASTELKYSGWMQAVVKYSARDRATVFEVNEKVLNNKDLFLNHTANSDEGKSNVGLRWNW